VKVSSGGHPEDTTASVQCGNGRLALSGGAAATNKGNPANPPLASDDPNMELSAPAEADGSIAEADDVPTGWVARIDSIQSPRTFSVYAVCGPMPVEP
jgi:hypothetical protein